MTEKFYTFVIGAYGVDSTDAYENLYDDEGMVSIADNELQSGDGVFDSYERAENYYRMVDSEFKGKSVPMDEIKAIQDELHELVWYNNPTTDDLKAILGKLQMLTDQ